MRIQGRWLATTAILILGFAFPQSAELHAQGGAAVGAVSGFDALLLSILNLRTLPPEARAAWRSLLEHYVFGDQSQVTAHIPPHRQGLLGPLTPAETERLREQIAQRLKGSR